MRPFNIIEKAGKYSKKAHGKQLDDCGKNYFETHVCTVVEILSKITNNQNIIAAGYLHDTIEDTETSYSMLKKEFGIEVADLVMEVTHNEHKTKGNTFPRLKSRNGILIKFADRLSNISRMDSWGRDRTDHYLRRSKFWKNDVKDPIIFGQEKGVLD